MIATLLALGLGIGIFMAFYGYALRKQVQAFDPLQAARGSEDEPSGKPTKSTARPKLVDRAKRWTTELAADATWIPKPLNFEQRLAWAGKLGKMTAVKFRGEQILYLLVMALLGFLVGLYRDSNALALILAVVLGLGGIYLPIYLLDQEGKKRQKEITLTLPDAVDLISTSVAAGLSIDRAITYAAQNISGPLAEEFKIFLQEMQLGMPRQNAYQELIWRNNSDEIQTIIGALLQGQSLGVPVSETLESQAETMRERRLQRAKSAGSEAAPRITCAMTGCLMPSIFLLFLAIVAFSVSQDFSLFSEILGGN